MSKPAAYTEEQARHWLWFLARNMQSHGQSMFMLEQLQPSWLLTKWQIFIYLLLSRTVMFGTLAMLFGCGFGIFNFRAQDFIIGMIGVGLSICVFSLIVGLLCALVLFLRTSDSLPAWFKSLARLLSLPFEFTALWLIVRPVQWALLRNGRTLNDDIQPVERISWSWMNFCKGLAFITIKPPQWESKPRLNRSILIIVWLCRLLWLTLLALMAFAPLGLEDRAMGVLLAAVFALPNLFCGFFSAIRGKSVELKTAPNLGILLSGRNALITVSINLVLAFSAKLFFLKSHLGQADRGFVGDVVFGVMLAGVLAWGRLGGLDYLAHYCLRFVLRRCGYIPRDYVRFLNYAATELGFLQKVGGGYVFMHRYLLEYFASSEKSSSGAANFSAAGQAASN